MIFLELGRRRRAELRLLDHEVIHLGGVELDRK
jgi:hypothetical protein